MQNKSYLACVTLIGNIGLGNLDVEKIQHPNTADPAAQYYKDS